MNCNHEWVEISHTKIWPAFEPQEPPEDCTIEVEYECIRCGEQKIETFKEL